MDKDRIGSLLEKRHQKEFLPINVYRCKGLLKCQQQFTYGKVNCITRSTQSALGFTAYEVVEQVSNSTFNKFVIIYGVISCEGILCHHSLSVLSFERVDKVVSKYILQHWSKNVKRRRIHIKSNQDEHLLEPRKYEELTGILPRAFDKIMAKMQEYQAKSKGCPKNRLGSNVEKKIANTSKKKKKATLSELNLLDGGSIIQSSSSLYHAQDMNYPGEDMSHYDRSFDV
ncbi:hypothetical protein Ahy_A09g044864 [Arachis hypogaea]|uniref:Protein FAR1-RELATED SEQUENCE n=1 Tax=Arachis hypogaea TaxID=3818 RepID=A0A445BKZ6_ARAHY|nr:hypothetical protein Ahy_A09g044864 [Arachis hypogaea]